MARLLKIFLLLSNILLLTDCSYTALRRAKTSGTKKLTSLLVHPVIPEDGTAVKYKAEIDVINKHFTGIIVIKQTDSLTKHCVFVTELGMRMFDFVIRGDSVKADFVFDALNKPAFVKILTANFRDILMVSVLNKNAAEKTKKNSMFYWIKDGKNSVAIWPGPSSFIEKLIVFSENRKHTITTYRDKYSNVKFKQSGLVKLKIELTGIEEENK